MTAALALSPCTAAPMGTVRVLPRGPVNGFAAQPAPVDDSATLVPCRVVPRTSLLGSAQGVASPWRQLTLGAPLADRRSWTSRDPHTNPGRVGGVADDDPSIGFIGLTCPDQPRDEVDEVEQRDLVAKIGGQVIV